MRPICLMLPVPAIPYTSVPNSSGAMMDLIRRRNIVLTIPNRVAIPGAATPSAIPAAMPRKIQPVRDGRFMGRKYFCLLPYLSSFSPLEFRPQNVEEHHARRANQMDGIDGSAADDLVA